jgi:hypothetical protein
VSFECPVCVPFTETQAPTIRAAKLIRDALSNESDDLVNYCFPKDWPADRERRARYIGEWLKTEAHYLVS